MTFRTRFAPSPTGPLHLGHAYSALLAQDMSEAIGGECLLRIEDIDRSRARPQWEDQIYDDLNWLGLHWAEPVMRQSERLDVYEAALSKLWDQDHLFHCTCTRRDIADALAAPQEGDHAIGPDGPIYPGTCRKALSGDGRSFPKDGALRLAMDRACGGGPFQFQEIGTGPNGETGLIRFEPSEAIERIGDIVLSRRDMGTSYHLSVVLDDAAQGITHVVRGQDLFEATKIHVILQRLLGLPVPVYHHHKLIRDDSGKRLAKRDDARAISKYRDDGLSPDDIRKLVGL